MAASLDAEEARYLFVRGRVGGGGETQLLGFASFRFTLEGEVVGLVQVPPLPDTPQPCNSDPWNRKTGHAVDRKHPPRKRRNREPA